MLVNWKYRPRNTLIQRLDPRARLIFLACMIIAITTLWDLRVVLPLFGMAMGLYLLARIEWRDVKRAWLFILTLVSIIVIINLFLGARGGPPSVRNDQSPLLFNLATVTLPGLGWTFSLGLSINKVVFVISQFIRMITMAVMGIPIPYTLDPSVYGATFKQMGASDKVAYSIDLAFRLVPSFGRDFMLTMDAQRARGYEVESLKVGLFERIRRLAPLIVPVVVHAILAGDEIVDAMELRAFGTNRRTWSRVLHYAARDYVLIGLGLIILVSAIIMGVAQVATDIWVPPFLYQWAGITPGG